QFVTFHVNSNMSAGKRKAYLDEFARERRPALMTNARCLGEGIDVPAIDCVAFVDPNHSVHDIIQTAGRAMRTSKKDDKKRGYILLRIVTPDKADPRKCAETTAFNEVARVLSALAEADTTLYEELRVIGNGRVPKRRKRGVRIVGSTQDVRAALNISL